MRVITTDSLETQIKKFILKRYEINIKTVHYLLGKSLILCASFLSGFPIITWVTDSFNSVKRMAPQ